jgi:hypothetical protein
MEMKKTLYPTIIHDNFFDNPDDIAGFLKTLDYFDPDVNYPGKRTNCLSTIDYDLYNSIVLKVLGNFYPDLHDVRFEGTVRGQIIEEEHIGGWIHHDPPGGLTFLIYLTPDANIDAGTNFYKIKPEYTVKNRYQLVGQHNDKKELSFTDSNEQKIKEAEKYRLEQNSRFTETLKIGNVYNRMIAFDGANYHAQGDLSKHKRLTLIGFIDYILQPSPILRTNSFINI